MLPPPPTIAAARKVLLIGLTSGGLALMHARLHLSYAALIASAVLLGLANRRLFPTRQLCDSFCSTPSMDRTRIGRAFHPHSSRAFSCGGVAPPSSAVAGGRSRRPWSPLIAAGAVGLAVCAGCLRVVGIPTPVVWLGPQNPTGVHAPRRTSHSGAIVSDDLLLSAHGAVQRPWIAISCGGARPDIVRLWSRTFSSAHIALTWRSRCRAPAAY